MGEFIVDGNVLVAYTGSDALVIIPDEISIIGENAFDNNNYVQSVLIPYSVTAIRDHAFLGCYSLSEVSFSDYESNISFGRGVFRNCNRLADENGLIIVGNICFGAAQGVTSVVIPDYVNIIASGAFEENTDIEEVYMHSDVEFIGRQAFKDCINLKKLEMDNPYADIMSEAFDGCYGLGNGCVVVNNVCYGADPDLEDVVIPEYVTDIDTRAFFGHKNLRSVVIPESVKYVGALAFCDCKALEKITILGRHTDFGSGVFSVCSNIREIYTNSQIRDYKMGRINPNNPIRVNSLYNVSLEIMRNAVVAFASDFVNDQDSLSPEVVSDHMKFIQEHPLRLMETILDNMVLLEMVLDNRLLRDEKCERYLNYAVTHSDPEAVAMLLEYMNR